MVSDGYVDAANYAMPVHALLWQCSQLAVTISRDHLARLSCADYWPLPGRIESLSKGAAAVLLKGRFKQNREPLKRRRGCAAYWPLPSRIESLLKGAAAVLLTGRFQAESRAS